LIERFKIANPYQEKFSVPTQLISYVCGKNYSNTKRVENIHNVHVLIYSVKDETEFCVKGPVARNVSAAKKDLLENLGTNMEKVIGRE